MSLSLLMLNAVIILASPYPPLSREREKVAVPGTENHGFSLDF